MMKTEENINVIDIEFCNANELSNFVEKFRYTHCANCSIIINISKKKYTKMP